MRQWKITCDRCGKEIFGNPLSLTIETVDRDTGEYLAENDIVRYDICNDCRNAILSKMTAEEASSNIPERDEESEESVIEIPPRKKNGGNIDVGKMQALKRAGWSYKQIAEEMKITEKQVSNHLYLAKKREEKIAREIL